METRQQAQVVCTYQVHQQKIAKGIGIILKSRKVFSNEHQQKIAKGIGIILKSRKVFSTENLLSLYHTFVYPYLSYCIHVSHWGH